MYRQLYQLGGGITQLGNGQEEPIFPRLETLSQNLGQAEQTLGAPSNQFDVSSIATAFTGRPPMNRGGVASLVDREQYGLGSSLKKFVRKIIPNEISSIAVKAAPFVAPFNPALAAAMAGIGGFDQTGRIGSSLGKAALVYGGGQLARGIGGAGFQGNPFTGVDFSGGFTSGIQSLFTSPMGNLPFGSFSTSITPTQSNFIGTDALTYDPTTGQQLGRSAQELQSTLSGTQPGYMELIKKAGSFENVPLSERFNAVKDLSTKALKDIYTTPVINPKTGETTYKLDKNSLYATFAGASSFIEAKKLANKAGVPEFSEADYQRLKVDPEKTKYTDVLKPGSFGIRPQSANGGLMDGVLSIKLTPAQAMAMGGRIGYQEGGFTDYLSNPIYQNFLNSPFNERVTGAQVITPVTLPTGEILNLPNAGVANQFKRYLDITPQQRPDDLGLPGQENLKEEILEEAMNRGEKFFDPIGGFQVNPLTGGRMGTGIDPNFIAQRAMQAEQDAAARVSPINIFSRGVSSNFLSPNQSMQQDLLMRSQAVPTGGTTRSISEGTSGISPIFRINRLLQAERDAAARVTPKKTIFENFSLPNIYKTGGRGN